MADTSLRQLVMLQLIPRRAPGLTTQEIRTALVEREFKIDLRSVQRDLARLSAVFPLVSDEQRTARWYWAKGAAEVTLPAQDPYSALTWQLIEEHLQPLLPRSVRSAAEPRFLQAREYLKAADAQRLNHWKERVRVLPRALSLLPPEVDNNVLDVIYDGLLEGLQIDIRYQRRSDQKINAMRIHPLALVLRDGVIYLLVTVGDYSDVRQIVAHRIRAAELSDEIASEPEGFDLDKYIREGGFAYSKARRVRLVVRFDAYSGLHLMESPLTTDQKVKELEDGRLEVTAEVLDSDQLRWWLLGFGSNVEVMAPRTLRDFMSKEALKQSERYQSQKGG